MTMPLFSPSCLQDKVAVVTGGSRGLGAGIAKHLAQYGAKVAITYVENKAAAGQVVAEIRTSGGTAEAYCCDVRNRAQVRETFEHINQQYGKLDILVNNAGVNRRKTFEETTDEDWDLVLDTNLKGAFICSQEALPYLKQSNSGRIINISSIASQMAGPKTLHYAVSKSGMDTMTRFLGRYCGPYGITAKSINPNIIPTKQTDDEVDSPNVRHEIEETPLGRLGTLDDVASAVIFLASEEAGYITGHILYLNGGRYL